MAALAPPFTSSNMLTLARKVLNNNALYRTKYLLFINVLSFQIAEAEYDGTPLHRYSDRLGDVVKKCLCVNPELRPDSIQV